MNNFMLVAPYIIPIITNNGYGYGGTLSFSDLFWDWTAQDWWALGLFLTIIVLFGIALTEDNNNNE